MSHTIGVEDEEDSALVLASATIFSSTLSSKPTTESMPCAPTAAAALMPSARTLTTLKASSYDSTPAKTRATYSPRDKPAHASHAFTTLGS